MEAEDRVPDSEYVYPFLDFSEFKSWRDVVEAHMDEVEILSGTDGTTVHMVKYEKKS